MKSFYRKAHAALVKTILVAMAALLTTAVAQAGLLVHWDFDEATTGTTTALNGGTLGLAADGYVVNGATRTGATTPGNYSAGAMSFTTGTSGKNAAVVLYNDLADLDTLSALTVTGWVNFRGDPAVFDTLVADRAKSGDFGGWVFNIDAVGAAPNQDKFRLGLSVNGQSANSGVFMRANQTWAFVAATWDGSTGLAQFFTGTESAATTYQGGQYMALTTMADNTANLNGGNYPGLKLAPNAWMDDIRIYNSVLDATALEWVRLENLTATPEPSALVLLGCELLGLLAYAWRRRK